MSLAWETTTDDVLIVLVRMNIHPRPEQVNAIHESLDVASIESAALHGDEMEEQTDNAYEEIQRQVTRLIKEHGDYLGLTLPE